MNCSSPGATHHLACDCREAEFAAELVAADHCRATADRALYAERCRVVDLEKKLAVAEGKGMAWERACEVAVMERDGARKAAQTYHDKLAVAEERARGMGEALREIGKHECRHAKLGDGIDCTRVGMVFPDGFTACPSCIARAALAPPPRPATSEETA